MSLVAAILRGVAAINLRHASVKKMVYSAMTSVNA